MLAAAAKDAMRTVRIEHDGSRNHAGTKVIDLATGLDIPCLAVQFTFLSYYEAEADDAFEATELRFNLDGDVGIPVETVLVKEFVWKEMSPTCAPSA